MTHETPALAAVIGWPVGHSKSPALHGYWLQKHGLRGHYIPIALRPENFEAGIRALPKLGFGGANITIPYKETVLHMASSVSDRASLIGAANTISFRPDGSIHADNTDGYGFIENLRQTVPDWDPRSGPALVVGAGGAAKAVVSALLTAGVPELRVANRTRARAQNLADTYGAKVVVVDWYHLSEAVSGAKTVANTTSLGMVGQPALNISLDAAPGDALVTDIVYAPLVTPLLEQARARGLRTVDGLGMLLHQAVPGFQHWFGIRPEVDEALRQYMLGLG
ncbi:shikimate dehydrogenase [Paroceanicella profunda]|uniref:Shikimate dehydrogenase (NADP(+)) n=1 Tax=Paroceanicella profunda TaxID=2579971 RepID=A0A5B8FYP7_9RHOB|nr:shikimate dehydrogenase [Paroceanicella profunda]QDL91303.1 shikimate dehydrogenase [Paroceanicella profunda]